MSDADKAPRGTGRFRSLKEHLDLLVLLKKKRLISISENVFEDTQRSVVYIVGVECGKEPVRVLSWVSEQPEVPVVCLSFFFLSVTSEMGSVGQ